MSSSQLHWNLQTALSTGEEDKVFHHNRNRSRARRNHINCKCSAINAKAKMDDNTNANMIYSNLQSKEQIVKSRSNTKRLTNIGISAWLSWSSTASSPLYISSSPPSSYTYHSFTSLHFKPSSSVAAAPLGISSGSSRSTLHQALDGVA